MPLLLEKLNINIAKLIYDNLSENDKRAVDKANKTLPAKTKSIPIAGKIFRAFLPDTLTVSQAQDMLLSGLLTPDGYSDFLLGVDLGNEDRTKLLIDGIKALRRQQLGISTAEDLGLEQAPGETQQQFAARGTQAAIQAQNKAASDIEALKQQQENLAMSKAQFLQEAAAAGLPDTTDIPARERLFQRNPQLKAAFNALQFQESTTPPAPNPTPDQLLGGAPFPSAPTTPVPSGGTATKTPTEIALGTSLPEDLKNLSPDEVKRRASQTGGVSTR